MPVTTDGKPAWTPPDATWADLAGDGAAPGESAVGTFGERLREARILLGLSLDKLATRTGISKGYLWRLETDPDVKPSVSIVQRLARSLGVPITALLVNELQSAVDELLLIADPGGSGTDIERLTTLTHQIRRIGHTKLALAVAFADLAVAAERATP